MRLIFVHGWSVTHTNTYGKLPRALSNAAADYGLQLDIQHIHLGRYVSFHDEVTVDDISRAMDRALRELPGNSDDHIEPFSCVTHSTGGPVVRHWVDRFYGADKLNSLPLKHLVMLAPANHGSALAVLGKARVGRIKAWFSGVEPGQRVLDWLALGSDGQWQLNESYLEYDYASKGFYPFVLTGQGIDEKFYDFINSYLVEPGSDGVVRVAGANMNYRYFSLVQSRELVEGKPSTFVLKPKGGVRVPKVVPIGVYKRYSHSGSKMGIMGSVKDEAPQGSPVVSDILKCFQVDSANDYGNRTQELKDLTGQHQQGGDRFSMLVFNVRDDQGEQIGQDDYDIFLLAGNKYQEKMLPKEFFKDRQMNKKTGSLVYYLNADKMEKIKNGKFGIRVVARPSSGFSYYREAEFRSDGATIDRILAANETTYVDIQLHRFVDENVFRFDDASEKQRSFKKISPSGKTINNG